MARYDYRYVDKDGRAHVVEQTFKMGEAPETVMVTSGGHYYEARRVFTPVNLQRSQLSEWSVDLPPIDAPMRENS